MLSCPKANPAQLAINIRIKNEGERIADCFMTWDEARQRIQSAIDQFGPNAAPMIELVVSEIRSGLGNHAANQLIEDFDLELEYNITPTEFHSSGD